MRPVPTLIATAVAAAVLIPATSLAQLNSVGEGRRAWLQYNCYGCHGDNASGGMGPNIQQAEAGDISAAMSGDDTEGGMRSFRTVVPSTQFATDVKNIAAYLNSIGTKNEPTWLDWWNPNP